MKFILLICFVASHSVLLAQQTDTLSSMVYHWNEPAAKKQNGGITKRSVMEGSTHSLSRLEVTEYALEPGKSSASLKIYDDVEVLLIMKEGEVTISVGSESKTMGRGSVVFAMTGIVYGVRNAGSQKAAYYMLRYKGKLPIDIERGKRAGGSLMLDWKDLTTSDTGKGYRRDFFNRPTSQLAQFEMHTTALNAGEESHMPHTHVQEEIILLLRGNVEMYIDGSRHKASAGDIVFLSSRVPHALTNIGDEQCEYFAFQWRN